MLDHLLLWCSEVGDGRLTAFRDCFDWLASRHAGVTVSWAAALANTSVLGHVEVDWDAGRWAVAPTSLVTMPNSGGLALLVGAQPRWLLRCLDQLPDDPDPALRRLADDVVFQPAVAQANAPSARYVLVADEASARRLCARLGIHYAGWVADELATMLPPLAKTLSERPGLSGPAGVEPRRMTGGGPQMWEPVEDDRADGTYEYKRYGPPRYVYRRRGRGFVADKRTAVYAELARTRRWVLRYDPGRRELLAPARMQLPLPHARAAVLNSGLLPAPARRPPGRAAAVADACVRYVNVDRPFAEAVAASLEQQLLTVE